MSEQLAPAQTYELNVLASAIGRFTVPEIDKEMVSQVNGLTDIALQRLDESNGPVVPNTMPELLQRAVLFDERLLCQLSEGPAGEHLHEPLLNASLSVITAHAHECRELLLKRAPTEQLIDPLDIAEGYGLPHIWDDAPSIIASEANKWGKQRTHPEVPEYLTQPVSDTETQQLIKFMWNDVLAIDHALDAHIYTTHSKDFHHLYWAPASRRLDYATPHNYDRATQLSFDLPHNVAHLAHLSVLDPEDGVDRYSDRMEERAFFEAVAVLAEYIMTCTCLSEPAGLKNMAQILSRNQPEIPADKLTNWVLADREYEFKLRAVRLYSDLLITQGASLSEAVSEISNKLGVSEYEAREEAKKYLPWTGLGAVYTSGYISLLNAGITTVSGAITGNKGPITTWAQFNSQNSNRQSSTPRKAQQTI